MSFQGDNPYGTTGGDDNPLLSQTPDDVRIAIGSSYVAYLLINGPITVRDIAAIQNVIRTIGSRGEQSIMGTVVKNNSAVIDSNVTEFDFNAGFVVTQVSPGVVLVQVPNAGIVQAMIANGAIGNAQLANLAVTAGKLANSAVGTNQIASGAVTPSRLDRTYREGATANPRVHGFASLGARTINSSVVNQSNITINFVPGVSYSGSVRWVFRGFAVGGTPADGAFRTSVAGVVQVWSQTQFDSGVDQPIEVVQHYDTSGGSSLDASWGYNWTDGTFQITTASFVEWDFIPTL